MLGHGRSPLKLVRITQAHKGRPRCNSTADAMWSFASQPASSFSHELIELSSNTLAYFDFGNFCSNCPTFGCVAARVTRCGIYNSGLVRVRRLRLLTAKKELGGFQRAPAGVLASCYHLEVP